MINELNPIDLDRMRFQAEPKPFRRLMDEKIIPGVTAAAAIPVAAVQAIANIKRTPRFTNI